MSTYQDAVAEFRRLDGGIEAGQWRQAQIVWEQVSTGVLVRVVADDTGKGEHHIRSLYRVWGAHGHSPQESRPAFADAYRMAETGAQTPEEASAVKDAYRVASAWRKLPPERMAGVADEMFREPAAIRAAIAALTATPESATRTYRTARDAVIRYDREQRGRTEPPARDDHERVIRMEQLIDDLIARLADILDPDL